MTDTRLRNTVVSITVKYTDPSGTPWQVVFGADGNEPLPEAMFWSDRGPEILGAYYEHNPRTLSSQAVLEKYGPAMAARIGQDVETTIDPDFVRQLWRPDETPNAAPGDSALPTLLLKRVDCTPATI